MAANFLQLMRMYQTARNQGLQIDKTILIGDLQMHQVAVWSHLYLMNILEVEKPQI